MNNYLSLLLKTDPKALRILAEKEDIHLEKDFDFMLKYLQKLTLIDEMNQPRHPYFDLFLGCDISKEWNRSIKVNLFNINNQLIESKYIDSPLVVQYELLNHLIDEFNPTIQRRNQSITQLTKAISHEEKKSIIAMITLFRDFTSHDVPIINFYKDSLKIHMILHNQLKKQMVLHTKITELSKSLMIKDYYLDATTELINRLTNHGKTNNIEYTIDYGLDLNHSNKSKLDDINQSILNYVSRKGIATRKEIQSYIGLSERTVQYRINHLIETNHLSTNQINKNAPNLFYKVNPKVIL